MLVDHGSGDCQGIIGQDGRRERCDQEIGRSAWRDRDDFRPANQSKAGLNGLVTSHRGREQTVATNASGSGGPGNRDGLNHRQVVVSVDVEIDRVISVGCHRTGRAQGQRTDVGRVEHHLRSVINVSSVA